MKTIVILSHVGFDNSPYCDYVHKHAKALKELGYNVIVFAILTWFPFVSLIRKGRKKHYKEKKGTKIIDDVTVIYKKALSFSNLFFDNKINLNGISYYLTIKRTIKRILKQNDVLFIDAHTFKVEGYVASLLHRKMKVNATVTCHGTSLRRTIQCRNSRHIVTQIINNLDYVICVSNSLENELKHFNVSNTKVIYNGINFYSTANEKAERNITIITVGNLIKQKNIDLTIKVFKAITKKLNDAKLVIVGQGKEKSNLEKLCKVLKLQDNVTFTGGITNKQVYELMQQSKIFLLPSINEGFGIVYAEAMYNGCITIGTKNEGIDGFIKNAENGFLVEPDVNKIAKLIEEIYSNKYDIENIKKNAYEDSKNLTWLKNAKEYVKLFSK